MSVPIKDNERFQFLILPVLPDHTSFVSLNLQKILINNTQQQFIWSKTLVSFLEVKITNDVCSVRVLRCLINSGWLLLLFHQGCRYMMPYCDTNSPYT